MGFVSSSLSRGESIPASPGDPEDLRLQETRGLTGLSNEKEEPHTASQVQEQRDGISRIPQQIDHAKKSTVGFAPQPAVFDVGFVQYWVGRGRVRPRSTADEGRGESPSDPHEDETEDVVEDGGLVVGCHDGGCDRPMGCVERRQTRLTGVRTTGMAHQRRLTVCGSGTVVAEEEQSRRSNGFQGDVRCFGGWRAGETVTSIAPKLDVPEVPCQAAIGPSWLVLGPRWLERTVSEAPPEIVAEAWILERDWSRGELAGATEPCPAGHRLQR